MWRSGSSSSDGRLPNVAVPNEALSGALSLIPSILSPFLNAILSVLYAVNALVYMRLPPHSHP